MAEVDLWMDLKEEIDCLENKKSWALPRRRDSMNRGKGQSGRRRKRSNGQFRECIGKSFRKK